jgi:GNAT superfamily N-acetyltransferase
MEAGEGVNQKSVIQKGMIHADLSLARRLERAEANANARFVEARERAFPGFGACWIEAAGASCMYDGPHSPCTQTFGLGLSRMPGAAEMDEIESFFRDRGAPAFHEVSSLADKAMLPLLNEREYRPAELSHVSVLPLAGRAFAAAPDDSLRVRVVTGSERQIWARTAVEGWRESADLSNGLEELMRVMIERDDSPCFLVERDGRPIATGGLAVHEGVALMAGAATVPEFRRLGAQRLLFESRLQFAADSGCDLAMIVTEPGSAAQRNAERQGFRIAYSRIKWGLQH